MDSSDVLDVLRDSHTTLPDSATPEEVGRVLSEKLERARARHDAISDLSDRLDVLLSSTSKKKNHDVRNQS